MFHRYSMKLCVVHIWKTSSWLVLVWFNCTEQKKLKRLFEIAPKYRLQGFRQISCQLIAMCIEADQKCIQCTWNNIDRLSICLTLLFWCKWTKIPNKFCIGLFMCSTLLFPDSSYAACMLEFCFDSWDSFYNWFSCALKQKWKHIYCHLWLITFEHACRIENGKQKVLALLKALKVLLLWASSQHRQISMSLNKMCTKDVPASNNTTFRIAVHVIKL